MRFFAFAISLSIGCSGSGSDPAPAAGDAGTIDVGADAQVDMGVPATGPGSLDPTFGTGGVVQRALPESITSFLPRTAVLTPDDGVDFTATYTSGSPGYGLGRIDANGQPWILEVNANPDIAPDAGLARMARVAGIEYSSLIRNICELALARAREIPQPDEWALAQKLSGVETPRPDYDLFAVPAVSEE